MAMIDIIAATAKAVAGMSLRKLIHLRTRSKGLASGASRICLRTLRAKKGDTSRPGTRPRRSHNSWSSSGFIFFQLNCLHARKLRWERRQNEYLRSRCFQETFELPDPGRVSHFAQRFGFDLADALSGDLELATHFFKRAAVAIH